jgi:sortase (surface protein transpeptidase)
MWAPIILGIIGLAYFGSQLNKPTVIEAPVAAQTSESAPIPISNVTVALQESMPTRLRIAKIGVNTSFVSIGKKADGTIEVPKGYEEVGWYNRGPTPGELGPAVVVGHVDRPGNTAVFWRLREMVPGDIFEIDRADGMTIKFRVDQIKQVPQDSFPTEEVYGNINYPGVRLITCGGTFNRSAHRYTHNTVVYGSMLQHP